MTCAVCGDVSEWLHYGALSCAGCKAFFRRTVRLNINYRCKLSGNCVVLLHSRNCCRGCRFRKCIEVGMNPKALRLDKVIMKQPKKRREDRRSVNDTLGQHVLPVSRPSMFSSPTAAVGRNSEPVQTSSIMRKTLSMENSPWKAFMRNDHSPGYPELSPELLRSSNADVETLGQKLTHKIIAIAPRNAATAAHGPSLAWQLAKIVAKAKSSALLSFLSQKEQMIVLKWYAPQIVMFDAILSNAARSTTDTLTPFRSLVCETTPADATDPNGRIIINGIVTSICSQLLPDFKVLNLDETEACYLRMLAMWNPELLESSRGSEVARGARANLLIALEKHIETRNLDETTASRMTKLLSFLAGVQHLSQNLRECIQVAIKLKVIVPDKLMEVVFEDLKPLSDSVQIVMSAAGTMLTDKSPAFSCSPVTNNDHPRLSPEYFDVFDSSSRPESFMNEIVVPSSPVINSNFITARPVVIKRNPIFESEEAMANKEDFEVTTVGNNTRLLLPLFQQ